ncbi:uncharacterized protein LOC111102925 [Crassostrea virginica]|uniref:Uncharacterized protein LOC111102925 n=1 Tax=Crassostrea virginica TaxID=6565 RepID=A0A8B8ALU9_CRAVI|nr:uncharacterized protein LOC111102925 [Crassostrea virginica]
MKHETTMKLILRVFYGLVLIVGINSASVSFLTDEHSSNRTNSNVTEINVKNVDVFRQLLNQETLIRMTMVKNVHSLMKDMLTLQENLAKTDNKMTGIQTSTDEEILELKKQVEWLKKENDDLKNNSVVQDNEIVQLKETLKNVNNTLTEVKIEVRYLSIALFGMDTHSKEIDKGLQELKNWTRKIEFEMMENVSNYAAAISDLDRKHLEYIDKINDTTILLKSDIDQYEIDQLKMSAAVSSLELFRINKTKCDVSTRIGFTAGVTSSSSTWNSGTLVFPKVITNVGNGYNSSDGVFTAPRAGVYVFFVNVQGYSNNDVYVDIVLNGANKVRTMAQTNYDAGPNLAVLSLQTGDRVWVKYHAGQGYYTYSDSPITTFSGFLI